MNSSTGLRDATNPQAPERGFTIPVHLAQPNSLNWASWVDDRHTELLIRDAAASGYSTWSHSREGFGILRLRLSTSISPERGLIRSAKTLSIQIGRLHCPEGQPDPILYRGNDSPVHRSENRAAWVISGSLSSNAVWPRGSCDSRVRSVSAGRRRRNVPIWVNS